MIGIDEVGRGAWAGPLLVAAVRLHSDIAGLTDSKLLSKRQRKSLCPRIQAAADIGLGWLPADKIDELGLSQALKDCAFLAVQQLSPVDGEAIIIDGTINLLPDEYAATTAIKAETKYPGVAAASIVAKVFRDRYMSVLNNKYPGYGFDGHVGYGTSVHMSAIKTRGALATIHRFSFKPLSRFGVSSSVD